MKKLLVFIVVTTAMASLAPAASDDADIERLRSFARDNPTSVDAWNELSTALNHSARERHDIHTFVLAESAAMKTLDISAINMEALVQLSISWLAQKRYREVVQMQTRILRIYPADWRAWALQGDAFLADGGYRGADSSYFVMYNWDQGFQSRVRIARNELRLRDFDKAVQYFDEALHAGDEEGADPHDVAWAHVMFADALYSRGYLEPAQGKLNYALSIRPDYAEAVALSAQILALQGKLDDAVALALRAVEVSDYPLYLSQLAEMYSRAGDARAAEDVVGQSDAAFKDLMSRYPDAVRADYADFLLDWDIDTKAAMELAYRESRLHRNPFTYTLLARAYLAQGNTELAWSSIGLALRRKTRDPEIYYYAAVIAKAAGKTDEFERYAREARDSNPLCEKIYGPL